MFRQDHRPIAEQGHSANSVTQFAQISRPRIDSKSFHSLWVNGRDRFPFAHCCRFQFRGNQRRQLFQSFAQGRNQQRQAIKTMIKILAEFILSDSSPQRAVRCANDTRVALEHSLRTQSFELTVLENAQDLYLCEGAHLRDLVEEESTIVSQFELSFHSLLGASKRATLVAKQLAFEERIAHCRGVEGHEWLRRTLGGIMNCVREQCFPGAGLPEQNNRNV